MSSKVVEANVGIHTLAMAVAVRPRPTTSFCCRHRRSMEASVPNCVPVKPLSSLSRAGACTVRLIFFFARTASSSAPVNLVSFIHFPIAFFCCFRFNLY